MTERRSGCQTALLRCAQGEGTLREEVEAFGYRYGTVGERFDALEDALAILDALFRSRGAPVTVEGRTASVHDARLLPRPVQDPIPVWVGGKGGPRLLRAAARHATGWNVVWRFTDEWYRGKLDDVAAACETVERDPASFRRTVGLYALLGEDEAAARAAFERGRAAMPGGAMDADPYERWCEETQCRGPPPDRSRGCTRSTRWGSRRSWCALGAARRPVRTCRARAPLPSSGSPPVPGRSPLPFP